MSISRIYAAHFSKPMMSTSKIDNLVIACQNPKVQISDVQLILGSNANLRIQTDFNGRTPLHFLASRSNISVFNYLLNTVKTFNIDRKDDMKWTALSNACHLGNMEMIHYLLNLNADTNIVDYSNKTLLHLLASNENLSLLQKSQLINSLSSKINPNALDKRGQDYRTVMNFTMEDLDRTGVDPFGRTILHWAAFPVGKYAKYAGLYAVRPDLINFPDDSGRTPLIWAVTNKKPNLTYINWLLENGAIVDHKDHGNKMAIHFAAFAGNPETVALLVARGANLYEKDDMGQTAISIAERYSQDLLKTLTPSLHCRL